MYCQKARVAFSKERKCDDWREYISGVAPNTALEFTMFERLEENRQKWEAKLEEDRKRFDLELFRWRQGEEAKIDAYNRRTNIIFVIIAAVGTLLAVGSMTPDSMIMRLMFGAPESAPLPASQPTVGESLTDDESRGIVEP